MKKVICDLCRKEITPADIHISFNIDIDHAKTESLDFHNICFNYFKRMAEELKKEEFYTIDMETMK